MRKIISFSLYGDNPKYTIGMVRNIELAKIHYPDWRVFIFYDSTVPENILKELATFDNVEFINVELTIYQNYPKMFWRFIPYNFSGDKEIIFIVRDSDSRISDREVAAVNDWIDSDKVLHVMRDHPHHDHPILGGMWGIKYKTEYEFDKKIFKFLAKYKGGAEDRMADMDFLKEHVYPEFKGNTICHDSFFNYPDNKKFPVNRKGFEFVGEVFDENDVPAFQRAILEDHLKKYPEKPVIKAETPKEKPISINEPLVSVIIPSFNRFNLLCNALQSIADQTYKNIEVIVIDDCSTDANYSSLLNQVSDKFKYYRMPENKKNPTDARNKGLELATGDYICFLDDDDTFIPEKIEMQLKIMQDKNSLFSCTEAYYSDSDSIFVQGNKYKLYFHEKFIDFIRQSTGMPKLPEYIDKPLNQKHNYLMTSSVMIHKSLIGLAGKFVFHGKNGIWEDYAYWLRCMDFSACLYIDIPLTFYNDSKKPNFIYRPL